MKKKQKKAVARGTGSSVACLALEVGGAPPSEFRLFVAGWNETENGRFLFDEDAAASVMAAYEQWGVELAIDLDHAMLEPFAPPEPTARDARGWFRIELRAGDLWAVNVRWTADGAARLTERRQRYVSPAFCFDPESRRITKIVNCAITALPATHNTPALMAASARGDEMDLATQIRQARDAATAGDMAACIELLDAALASSELDVEDPEVVASDSEQPKKPAKGAPKPQGENAHVAVTRLMRLTQTQSYGALVSEVERFRQSHLELERERNVFASERAAMDRAERRRLYARLVVDAGWTPAQVWADSTATDAKTFLSSLNLEGLRAYVEDAVKANPNKGMRPWAPRPPRKGARVGAGDEVAATFQTTHGEVELSARELRTCAELKAKPLDYATNKAIHEAARAASHSK